MIGGTLQIDATASRASYGLLTPSALSKDIADRARAKVLENIGEVAAEGDRLAKAYNKANSFPEIAAEQYISQPVPDVALVPIARPEIRYIPNNGSNIDITA